jgi:hypothetical protein
VINKESQSPGLVGTVMELVLPNHELNPILQARSYYIPPRIASGFTSNRLKLLHSASLLASCFGRTDKHSRTSSFLATLERLPWIIKVTGCHEMVHECTNQSSRQHSCVIWFMIDSFLVSTRLCVMPQPTILCME